MSDYAIDIQNTWKQYRGKVQALRGVALQVPPGQVFGLLGPNGAGKSTLVKILTSIVRPTRCEGTLLGQRIGHKPTLAQVGYLPEHARFPDYLRGHEVLQYVAGLAGVPTKQARAKAQELVELVGMAEWAQERIGTYSKGMRQRIGLAQALVHDPDLIFLDEPTDGVDPQGRRDMREVLIRLREQGRTVFINSHLLGELEMICDSVAILNQGTVAKQGTIKELTAQSQRIEIDIIGDLPPALLTQYQAQGAQLQGATLTFYQSTVAAIQPVLDDLRQADLHIARVQERRQTLEDLFLSSVGDSTVGAQRAQPRP